MKFGGAPLADGENIRLATNIIAKYAGQDYRIVVAVSALKGVTDGLLETAERAKKGDKRYVNEFIKKLSEKHLIAAEENIKNKRLLGEVKQILKKTIRELEKILTGIIYVGELTSKSADYVLSFGERLSTPILWGTLRDMGFNTQFFTGGEAGIVTNSNFGEADPLMDVTKHQVREKIGPLLEEGIIPVVTGYIAANQDGVITTLGRGGSDYTATILGAALAADEVWIWKDVDGLMTSDPKIVPLAKVLRELSFQEAIEMAIFGAKAIHPKALEPAIEENIPVRIRNIFNPEDNGTLLVKEQKIKSGDAVKAVTLVKDVALVNVSGAGMVGTPRTAAKVFDVLGRNNINTLMISQSVSEANISFIIRRDMVERAVNMLEITFLGGGLIREVKAEDDVCVVAVVGAGMKGTPGVASRVFGAVARRGINIIMIAQGSSELNISFVVKEADGEEAVRAIHEEFKLDEM